MMNGDGEELRGEDEVMITVFYSRVSRSAMLSRM